MARLSTCFRSTAAALLATTAALLPTSANADTGPSVPIGAPVFMVDANSPAATPGYIFYSTGLSAAQIVPAAADALSKLPPTAPANIVVDKAGHEVWRYIAPTGHDVSNFQPQMYRGKHVMTWWEGDALGGHGNGADIIADEHGHVIDTVKPGGFSSDVHEFKLTPDGHALITSYRQIPKDLSPIGGPKNGQMLDTVASVVDVASKRVLSEWSAAQHIPLTDTTCPQMPGSDVYDPYHLNSIEMGPHGDLLLSMRDTSAVYDVDAHSGNINWQLGGKRPSLAPGPGVDFAFQHDAQFTDANTIRLFNNNSSGTETHGPSSVQWIHIDPAGHRANLVRNQIHPDAVVAFAMGNAAAEPNGNTLVGWGMAPRISEYAPNGDQVFDARLPLGSYRAFPSDWTPTP